MEIAPGPETLQVTEVSETPTKLAENCVVPPASTLALAGVIEMFCELIFTVAESESVLTALEVAVMVAVVAAVTELGAV